MTNAEKIRNMNDEELAALISSGEWSCICPMCNYYYTPNCRIDDESEIVDKEMCKKGALEWLISQSDK